MKDYEAHQEQHARKNIILISVVGLFCAIVAGIGVTALFVGADMFGIGGEQPAENSSASGSTDGSNDAGESIEQIEIGIAYGTEKKRWLKEAVEEWKKTPGAQQVKINLIPMGSIEGAH
ncbi:MAG: hypothetical protein KDB32_11270, partial [Planctomycetes bacterium]|nr:hypothetical protein [Planctomycetota bacterium]